MSGRRNSLDVTVNILESARGGAIKTRIVYGSNLNFEIVKGYINTLVNGGFLEVEGIRYSTTKKGVKFMEDYHELMKPLQSV